MLVVGLTGGIGSGKSTATSMLESLGVPIVDADVIAHELTASSGPALDAIRKHWGEAAILDDGQLNRNLLRERVFHHPEELAELEAILHPLISAETARRIELLSKQNPPPAYCIVVIPLMIEKALTDTVQRIVVVDVPVELQIERAHQRDGKSRENIESIISRQATREQRLAAADFVIDNSASKSDLEKQVNDLHETLVKESVKDLS